MVGREAGEGCFSRGADEGVGGRRAVVCMGDLSLLRCPLAFKRQRQGGQNTSHPFVAISRPAKFVQLLYRFPSGRLRSEVQRETSAQSLHKLLAHLRVVFVHLKPDRPNSPKFLDMCPASYGVSVSHSAVTGGGAICSCSPLHQYLTSGEK